MHKNCLITTNSIHELLAKKLKITPDNISFINGKNFIKQNQRYLYTLVESFNDKPAFVKVASPNYRKKLCREYLNLALALRLNLTDLNVLYPYKSLNTQYSFYVREQIDLNKAIILSDIPMIVKADPVLGKIAGHFLAKFAGKMTVPEDFSLPIVESRENINKSVSSFWRMWDKNNQIFFTQENLEEIKKNIDLDYLLNLVRSSKKETKKFLNDFHRTEEKYFAHNDLAPSNIYYIKKGIDDYSVALLDFEHSGVTYCSFLAQVSDLGNFYGRLWPNPRMQKEYVIACTEELSPLSHENYLAIKISIIFTTIHFARFQFESPSHIHTKMSKSLLKNLEKNLKILEDSYKKSS